MLTYGTRFRWLAIDMLTSGAARRVPPIDEKNPLSICHGANLWLKPHVWWTRLRRHTAPSTRLPEGRSALRHRNKLPAVPLSAMQLAVRGAALRRSGIASVDVDVVYEERGGVGRPIDWPAASECRLTSGYMGPSSSGGVG